MEPGTVTEQIRPVGSSRWLVLGAFSLLVACTQLLWLSVAPVSTQAHQALHVSEGAIGDLAGIQPLLYVLLALPAGRLTDRRFGLALSAGALLTAGGAVLRAVVPGSFGWILAGQFLVAIGQPLVLNATTKIAARYFPLSQRTMAISVASAAQFVGILVAATTAGLLWSGGGLRLLLLVHAGITLVAAVLVLAAVRVPASFVADATEAVSLRWLARDRVLWRLAGLLFIGVGIFNAVATWLDAILSDFGRSGYAGTLIAVMTVSGIVGAAVLPGTAARRDHRRTVLFATIATTAVVFLSIAAVHDVVFIGIALAVEGFVLLAGLPVALDWSELHVGPAKAATATGFLLLAGNLGGTVLVLVVQAALRNPYLALGVLALIALPGLLLAAQLPARVTTEPDGASPQGAGRPGVPAPTAD